MTYSKTVLMLDSQPHLPQDAARLKAEAPWMQARLGPM